MKSKINEILLHPVTKFNLLVVGFLIGTMGMDVESYVRNFCKKNLEKCERIISDFD